MTVAERFYSINYFKSEKLVELTWLPGTREMTDQDFKEALCVFAEGALQHRASRLIIDMRQLWLDHPPRSARGAMKSLFPSTRRLA